MQDHSRHSDGRIRRVLITASFTAAALSGCTGSPAVLTAPRPVPSTVAAPTPTPTAPVPGSSPTPVAPGSTPTPVAPSPSPSPSSPITITYSNPFGGQFVSLPDTPNSPGYAGPCSPSDYSQDFTASEPNVSTFTAVSSAPAQASVVLASGGGTFTVTEPMTNTNGTPISIAVSDTKGNTTQVPVGFNVVCLP